MSDDNVYTFTEEQFAVLIAGRDRESISESLSDSKDNEHTQANDESYSYTWLEPAAKTSKYAKKLKVLNMLSNGDHCMITKSWKDTHLHKCFRTSGYRIAYVTGDRRYTCWLNVKYETVKSAFIVKHPTRTQYYAGNTDVKVILYEDFTDVSNTPKPVRDLVNKTLANHKAIDKIKAKYTLSGKPHKGIESTPDSTFDDMKVNS